MNRIKPSEVAQAQRFSTGRERVDESLIERYREQGADSLAAVMRREIDRAFDTTLGELSDLLETGLGR